MGDVINPNTSSDKPYLKRLFSGRLNKESYLYGDLWSGVGLAILALPPIMILSVVLPMYIIIIISLPILSVASIFQASVAIRRLHDLGKSGWTYFWIWIPILGFALGAAMLLKPGMAGRNEWGDEPKPGINAHVVFGILTNTTFNSKGHRIAKTAIIVFYSIILAIILLPLILPLAIMFLM